MDTGQQQSMGGHQAEINGQPPPVQQSRIMRPSVMRPAAGGGYQVVAAGSAAAAVAPPQHPPQSHQGRVMRPQQLGGPRPAAYHTQPMVSAHVPAPEQQPQYYYQPQAQPYQQQQQYHQLQQQQQHYQTQAYQQQQAQAHLGAMHWQQQQQQAHLMQQQHQHQQQQQMRQGTVMRPLQLPDRPAAGAAGTADHPAAGARRPQLSLPPGRRPPAKRKQEYVPPLEPMTQDAVPRAALNASEAKEIEQWIEERKRHFPSAANLEKKDAERDKRQQRGELDPVREDRRQRLAEVLARQRAMGLSKKAGTEDMYAAISRPQRGRGRGRGRAEGGPGRGRFGGRPQPQAGWESFQNAGDAPRPFGGHQQQQGQWEQQAGRAEGAGPADEGAPAAAPNAKRELDGDGGERGSPGKRPRSGEAPLEGLAALSGYGSDGGGGGQAEAGALEPQAAAAREPGSPSGQGDPSAHQHHPDGQPRWQQQQQGRGQGRDRGRRGGGRDRGRGDGRGRFQAGRGGRGDGRGRFQGDGRGDGRGRGRGGWQDQQRPQRQWQPRPQPPTLLQKLLAKEIRQDHSYLLQAFRFMVNNNFLVGHTPGAPLQLPQDAAQPPPEPAKPSLQELLGNPDGMDLELSGEESGGDEGLDAAPPLAAAAVDDAGSDASSGEEEEEEVEEGEVDAEEES